MHRQYVKNLNRFVEVTQLEGQKTEGVLTAVDETGIVVEETVGKGKKAEIVKHTIAFSDIKSTQIQIKF
jgi:ribosome maturation factor RimP